MTSLESIRTKVRRLTGRPSTQQITDAQIDDYVNTYYLYDMPEELRLFHLHTSFEFMTDAYVSEYSMSDIMVSTDTGLQRAIDVYYNLNPPAYCERYEMFYSQSPEQFNRIYPQLPQIDMSLTGDGTVGPYTFTFTSAPILQNTLTIGCVDDTGATVKIVDDPQSPTSGNLKIINLETAVTGSIAYVTGAVSVTFANAIPSGNQITITGAAYAPARPLSFLYYADIIRLFPVPDAQYKIKVLAYQLPSALLQSSDNPQLKQWWQLLAYGASLKIFQDSQDPEGAAVIMPELKEQEALVLRRTIVQNTNERSATIYSEQLANRGNVWNGGGWGWW